MLCFLINFSAISSLKLSVYGPVKLKEITKRRDASLFPHQIGETYIAEKNLS